MEEEIKLTRHQRYYALHRAAKLSKENEKYNTNPEVIARREERERKRIAREAEQEVKRQEKHRIREERAALVQSLALAASMKKNKITTEPCGLDK